MPDTHQLPLDPPRGRQVLLMPGSSRSEVREAVQLQIRHLNEVALTQQQVPLDGCKVLCKVEALEQGCEQMGIDVCSCLIHHLLQLRHLQQ